MKHILLLLSLFILITPLFGGVIIPDTVSVEYRRELESVIGKMTEGRREVDVKVEDFVILEERATFSLVVGEERMETTVPLEYLAKEVENMLEYSKALFLSGPVLDYAEDGFYSTSSFPGISKGNLLWLLDGNGKREGLFAVLSLHGDAGELEPVYIGNALPGMILEKARGFDCSLLFALDTESKAFLSSLSLDFHTPLYPFLPAVGFAMENVGGMVGVYGEAGLKVGLPLASLFPTVSLVKNVAMEAGAYILLGTKGAMNLSGFWNVEMSYRILPSLSLSLGFARTKGSGRMVSLSLGGTL